MADKTTAAPIKRGTHGGARKGAGRPVKKHVTVDVGTPALDFLTKVYESDSVPMPLRIRAASVVVGATVAKPGAERIGKKAAALREAQALANGGSRFGGVARPPLHVVAAQAHKGE